MLGYLFEKTTALVRETYNAVEATVEYAYEDITSIPEAISKGWEEGIFTKETPSETPVKEDTPSKKFGSAN